MKVKTKEKKVKQHRNSTKIIIFRIKKIEGDDM